MVKDGVGEPVAPAIFYPFFFAFVRLQAHTQFSQYARRACVLGNCHGPDTMHAQISEAKTKDLTCRFRRISLVPMLAGQLVADIGFAQVCVIDAHAAIADELPVLF